MTFSPHVCVVDLYDNDTEDVYVITCSVCGTLTNTGALTDRSDAAGIARRHTEWYEKHGANLYPVTCEERDGFRTWTVGAPPEPATPDEMAVARGWPTHEDWWERSLRLRREGRTPVQRRRHRWWHFRTYSTRENGTYRYYCRACNRYEGSEDVRGGYG